MRMFFFLCVSKVPLLKFGDEEVMVQKDGLH